MQVDLPPTPTNLDPIHLPANDLLGFIQVQQWVLQHLKFKPPLLQGVLVLVPSADLHTPATADLQETCGFSSKGSSTDVDTAFAAAVTAAVPWRLRQVSAVQVSVGADPADASVLLEGPDRQRVTAGAVGPAYPTDVGNSGVSKKGLVTHMIVVLQDLLCL